MVTITDNWEPNFDEARRYLLTGGLGEVVGLTDMAIQFGKRKVQSDSDMMMALCIIAQEAIDARTIISDLIARIDDDPNFVPDSEALLRAREFVKSLSISLRAESTP
jgi:hypothetical protein